ncbi:uncharacterized protein J3R85_017820 [Psidium guajava]|nr:uncharacterized protein J3R85_017820 [Psidium guajava]
MGSEGKRGGRRGLLGVANRLNWRGWRRRAVGEARAGDSAAKPRWGSRGTAGARPRQRGKVGVGVEDGATG